jgi:hypothetical protein
LHHFAEVGIWSFDLVTGNIYASDKLKNFFGAAPDEAFTYETFINAVIEQDRDHTHQVTRM